MDSSNEIASAGENVNVPAGRTVPSGRVIGLRTLRWKATVRDVSYLVFGQMSGVYYLQKGVRNGATR